MTERQSRLKTAIIQLSADSDKKKNRKQALSLVEEAVREGAKLILLPEVFNYRNTSLEMTRAAESIPGPSLEPLMAIAKKEGVCILAGSIIEKGEDGRCYNSSVLINEQGELSETYRKMHLFDVAIDGKEILESKTFSEGTKPVIATAFGLKLGLSICYDLRFPELYRYYAKEGVDLILLPSSFTRPSGAAHWELLLRARAVENLCYVLAPNQVGIGAAQVPSYGNSMIIDPWGKVIERASGEKTEIIFGIIDTALLEKYRTDFPVLEHRNATLE